MENIISLLDMMRKKEKILFFSRKNPFLFKKYGVY